MAQGKTEWASGAALLRGAVLALAVALWAAVPASAQSPVEREGLAFVTVDATDAPSDPETGVGAASEPFLMGRHEITNAQYAAFLNAVARQADPLGLYSPLMATHWWGGITRQGEPGARVYAPKDGYSDLPVTFVAWSDAMRFANWLHYGRPSPGFAGPGTTEGDSTSGAYDTSADDPVQFRRNPGARFRLPTREEWLTAGFYDPRTRSWRRYATPDEPGNAIRATYFTDGGWTAPLPHLTPVGTYADAPSPFGTFDQAGNVMEWLEHVRDRIMLAAGGSTFMGENSLRRTYIDGEHEGGKLSTFGFRLAAPLTDPAVEPVAARPLSLATAAADEPLQRAMVAGLSFVTVGDPGAMADPVTRRGFVAEPFLIGETAVDNTAWAEMLNAVGTAAEALCLFHPAMENGIVGGLRRSADGPGPRFAPKPGWERRPVTYLTWYTAARYANFLHHRTTDPQSAVTEGDDRTGAYDTRGFPRACGEAAADPAALPSGRNAGARVFLPSVDEWFKAAYRDPQRYGKRGYWRFPLRSDSPPNNLPSPGDAQSANYQVGDTLGEGPPYYVSTVDAYPLARGPWGALGQAGNVWEWMEDWRSRGEGGCWRCDEWVRALAGGSFNYNFLGLAIDNVDPGAPHQSYPFYGLRLAAAISPDGYAPPAVATSGLRARLAETPRTRLVAAAFVAGAAAASVTIGGAIALRRLRRRM